jgi:hypothetical protein
VKPDTAQKFMRRIEKPRRFCPGTFNGRSKSMENALKQAFEAEMAAAKRLLQSGRLDQATRHLERAHVLGQSCVVPHVRSHWLMLRVGMRRGAASEVWGQAVRIVLGAFGSAIGVVPVGNTGGTDISMFKRLPIAPDIAQLLEGR